MHHGCYLVHCHGSGFVQSPCSLICFLSRLTGARPFCPLPLRLQGLPGAFSYQVTFELGQAAEDVEDESAPGVLVSIDSVNEWNCTPLASNSLMSSTRFCRDRPSLSSFQTTTVSPSSSRSSMWSSSDGGPSRRTPRR